VLAVQADPRRDYMKTEEAISKLYEMVRHLRRLAKAIVELQSK